MAAPQDVVAKLWQQLGAVIVFGDVETDGRFLGCTTEPFETTAENVIELLEQHPSYHKRPHLTKDNCNGVYPAWTIDPKKKVRGTIYNMEDVMESCVANYCKLANIPVEKLKYAATPFMVESNDPCPLQRPVEEDAEHTDES